MSIANFFDKTALGASQVLQNYDRREFEYILLSNQVKIVFDKNGASTREGRALLDILIRLLARLYPKIQIEGCEPELVKELQSLAISINPHIEFGSSEESTVAVCIGLQSKQYDMPTLYAGSDRWVCKFSNERAVGCADSNNPFGAGVAACMAAANVFRIIFREQLPLSNPDNSFSLSLLNYTLSEDNMPDFEEVHFGDVHLVGLGAIGNGFSWTLGHIKGIKGRLIPVDHETVSPTNLQRYVLADQDSIDTPKVNLIKKFFAGTSIVVDENSPMTWEEYVTSEKHFQFREVVTCVDNAHDRIMIQGALPEKIFNAWTQHENLGVSRHFNFLKEPCLCCLYFPTGPRKSRSQEIADQLNVSDNELLIRKYLAHQLPFDEPLLEIITEANRLDSNESLKKFIGQPVDIFYSEMICGGALLHLRGNKNNASQEQIQVPSAFESALAGILLAAEFIKDKLNYPTFDTDSSIRFNLIRALTPYLFCHEDKKKDCICSDPIYRNVYAKKWT